MGVEDERDGSVIGFSGEGIESSRMEGRRTPLGASGTDNTVGQDGTADQYVSQSRLRLGQRRETDVWKILRVRKSDEEDEVSSGLSCEALVRGRTRLATGFPGRRCPGTWSRCGFQSTAN